MPTITPNFGLKKPLTNENYDIKVVTNDNMEVLDSQSQPKLISGTNIKTINSTSLLDSGNIDVQEQLVSGTNIKTINGDSILGSGDLPILMPRNWIINGMFDVWQRSTSQTTSGYGSDDRFNNINFGSTKTHSQQAFTVGQTAVPNNPKYFSRTVVSSVAGVDNYASKAQQIEDVVKLAGKTITFSFWAKADANKNMAIEFVQNFGSGGSDSVVGIGVQKFALTSSWQKFTKTITLPSVSGKTIGIDNYLALSFWFDAGSNFNARTDSLGQQSGTFDIANVSLVEGSVAVECQNEPYSVVLDKCLDYCWVVSGDANRICGFGKAMGTTTANFFVQYPKPMRTAPTISFNLISCVDPSVFSNAVSNLTTSVVTNASMQITATTTGLTNKEMYLLRIDTTGYIIFSAEL